MRLEIPLTDEDLNELQRGKVFDWVFKGIEVKLYNGADDE